MVRGISVGNFGRLDELQYENDWKDQLWTFAHTSLTDCCTNRVPIVSNIENCNSVGAGAQKVGKVWPNVDPNFPNIQRAWKV